MNNNSENKNNKNKKKDLIEETFKVDVIKKIEKKIGYTFKNKSLLKEAFIRSTYSEEHKGPNNEVLEFIGDKVIDLVAIKALDNTFNYYLDSQDNNESYLYSKLEEGELSSIKKEIVQSNHLAIRLLVLKLDEYIIGGKGDSKNTYSIYEDTFEAIVGAIAVDTNYDTEKLYKVVSKMLNLDNFMNAFNVIYDEEALFNLRLMDEIEESTHHFYIDKNYIYLIEKWCQKHGVTNYSMLTKKESTRKYETTINIPGYLVKSYPSSYDTYIENRLHAAEYAYDELSKEGLVKDPLHELIVGRGDKTYTQVYNEAVQKKILAPIDFKAVEGGHDKNGNPLFDVIVNHDTYKETFHSNSRKAKEAIERLLDFYMNAYLTRFELDKHKEEYEKFMKNLKSKK